MSTIKKQIEDWLEKKKTHDGQSTNPCGCNFSHFEGMKKGKIISTKMWKKLKSRLSMLPKTQNDYKEKSHFELTILKQSI